MFDITTAHLVTAAIGFAIIVTVIFPVLATMVLEIGVNGVELRVDIAGGISNHSTKLFVRQQLMTIWYWNRYLSSFQ